MTKGHRSSFTAIVKENVSLCREHYRLTLLVPQFPPTEPGQFVQVLCHDPGEPPEERELNCDDHPKLEFPRSAMLRRPFSLAGRRDTTSGVELDIIHRVVGVGTEWLSHLKLGDGVSVLGPLGNKFELPPPGEIALLVAGGVGIPPMLYLAERLKGRAVAFCGATTCDLLPFTIIQADALASEPAPRVAEFNRHNIPSVITTDDGSFGYPGYVTQALEHYLDETGDQSSAAGTIYTCGPEIMMKRVADISITRGIRCEVAVERAMACGMGTCQSCCIRVKDDRADLGWHYRLACTDGPIFAASELLW